MRPVIQEMPAVVELASSGSSGITWAPVDKIRHDASAGGNSDITNLRVRFPAIFDEDAQNNGLYNARFWLESMPSQSGNAWFYKLKDGATLVSGDFGNTTLSPELPAPLQYVDIENIDKTLYFDSVNKYLSAIQLQLTAAIAPTDYDTDNADSSNPRLIIEWERQETPELAAVMPNPNSDHLWEFSQVDIYVNSWVDTVTGLSIDQRYLIGWCPDDKFSIDLSKDKVMFEKGKPSATAVSFFSKIKGKITGDMASLDPWFLEKAFGITSTEVNGRILFTETNKQRPIPILDMTVEWFTNSGHCVQLNIPRAQLEFTNAKTPGGTAIATQAFSIDALVNPGSRAVWKMYISKSPVQRAGVEIEFGVTG